LRWNLDQNTKYIDRVNETLRQFLPQTLGDTLLYLRFNYTFIYQYILQLIMPSHDLQFQITLYLMLRMLVNFNTAWF